VNACKLKTYGKNKPIGNLRGEIVPHWPKEEVLFILFQEYTC